MIYTVSFNPSLDYVQDLDRVNLGYVNRTSGEKILPGGKGINGIEESWIRESGTWIYGRIYRRGFEIHVEGKRCGKRFY